MIHMLGCAANADSLERVFNPDRLNSARLNATLGIIHSSLRNERGSMLRETRYLHPDNDQTDPICKANLTFFVLRQIGRIVKSLSMIDRACSPAPCITNPS